MSDHVSRVLKIQPVPPDRQSNPLAELAVSFALIFAESFLVMAGMNAAHSLWPQIPAADYQTSLLLFVGLSVVARAVRGPRNRWWSR